MPGARRIFGQALAASALLAALALGGCINRSPADVTGSISAGPARSPEQSRQMVEELGRRYDASPRDPGTALAYAAALRASDQHAQSLAVLQQAAIGNPQDTDLLAAYGKALLDNGRYREAADVLGRSHSPDRPDWRILSAQGAAADQLGEHELAQKYYQTALRIVPGEPSVVSNLGLSYALAKRLDEAERVLAEAAADSRADARVRRNLALVLALQGRFAQAETVLRRDLSQEDTAATLASLRRMVAQPNSWDAIRRSGRQAG
jgi:Flp pilus assembly protein TadD